MDSDALNAARNARRTAAAKPQLTEEEIERQRDLLVDPKWGFEIELADGTKMIMQNR